jgi:hypothetical protein
MSRGEKTGRFITVWLLLALLSVPALIRPQQETVNRFSAGMENPVAFRNWMVLDMRPFPSDTTGIPKEKWIPLEQYAREAHANTGIWWLKAEVVLDDAPKKDVLALYPRGYFSPYEIYWDSLLVGNNGQPGETGGEEKAGKIFYITHIPDSLTTPGLHTLHLKMSNHSRAKREWYRGMVLLGYYSDFLSTIHRQHLKFFFIFGILFITTVFNVFLFISRGKKAAHLIFSLLCLTLMADFVTAFISVFKNVSAQFIRTQPFLFSLEALLIGIFFTSFFVYEFDFPKKKIVYGIVSINVILYFLHRVWLSPGLYESRSLILLLILATPLTIWAVFKKREGSRIALAGIILAVLAFIFDFRFGIYRIVIIIAIMVFCYSMSIALQFARSEKKEKAALLRSNRLEIEILKKYINPHFLMNSLTSIIVWLRKDAKAAVKLVEALADEFRMISKVSNLRTIPVLQEVAICRAHLKIMSFRRGDGFELETEGIEERDEIPPLVFHTLIENGLSHGYEDRNGGHFKLVRREIPGGVRFVLFNDSSVRKGDNPRNSGMGMKYVNVRLEESFPGRWKLSSRNVPNGWEVVIDILDG